MAYSSNQGALKRETIHKPATNMQTLIRCRRTHLCTQLCFPLPKIIFTFLLQSLICYSERIPCASLLDEVLFVKL